MYYDRVVEPIANIVEEAKVQFLNELYGTNLEMDDNNSNNNNNNYNNNSSNNDNNITSFDSFSDKGTKFPG